MRRHAKAPSAASTSSTGLRAAIALAGMTMLFLVFLTPSAPAFFTHDLEASFGSGVLSRPSALAVDGSGNVLVANVGSSDVRKFDSAGNPVDFSALGSNSLGPFGFEEVDQLTIDDSGGVNDGNIYVAKTTSGGLEAFKPSGAPANFTASAPYISGNVLTGYPGGSFSYTCGVAVDSNGTIYVGDYFNGVSVFAPSGEYLVNVAVPNACNVAVDSGGTLYVAAYFGSVSRFQPSSFPITAATVYGEGVTPTQASQVRRIAIDPVNDNLYGTDTNNGYNAQYDSVVNGNALIGKFGPAGAGIAIDRSGGAHEGSIYVSGGGEVKRYGPALTLADLTVADASAIAPQAATLNATISAAGGPAAGCQFQYVTEADFQGSRFAGAATAPCSPAGPFTGSGTEAVSASISGLLAGTAYRFRLHSTNANGSIDSGDLSFTTASAVKEVLTAPATNVTTTGATFNGSVNPGGIALGECKFEYGLTEILGSTVPCAESPGSIGSGEAPVSVHADVTGLSADIYHYRLVASNAIGTTKGDSATVAIPGAPVILDQSSISESFRAVLKARINPGNKSTTYRFEYGTTTAYGQNTEEEGIAAGNDPVDVAQEIKELAGATTYHYRVVAVNAVAEIKGADQTFTTDAAPGSGSCSNAPIRAEQGSIYLPECRAYEKVSPENKLGRDVFLQGDPESGYIRNYPTSVAPDGSAASFQSQGAFGDAASGAILLDFVSRRGPGGWSAHSISSSDYLTGGSTGRRGFLGVNGWSEDLTKAVVSATTGSPLLASGATPAQNNLFLLEDVYSEAYRALTQDPGSGPFPENSTELVYVGGSTDLRTVVFEDPVPHTANAPVGVGTPIVNPYAWGDGGLKLVSILPDPDGAGPLAGKPAPDGAYVGRSNGVSDDGSRIFFSTPDGRVFVRKNGSTTVEISASQKSTPDPQQPAAFATATPDGRYAFFSTEEQLLPGDTDAARDLYRYDVDTGTLLRLTNGGYQGTLGVSDDGSYVYIDTGSLHVWHDGQIDFVISGRLDGGEAAENVEGPHGFQVTPDGTTAAFLSGAQAYVYDAVSSDLRCASCRGDGQPSSSASLPSDLLQARANLGVARVDVTVLSSDGERLFFTTTSPLVAADSNEKSDVYEYVNGRQYLISSGTSNRNSHLLNATPSGRDVLFATREPLVRRDGDASVDIYSARIGGGFSEPPPELPCSGASCRLGGSSAPQESSAGSAQFSGSGNVKSQEKKHKKKSKKKRRKHHKKQKQKAKNAGSHRGAGK